MNQNHKIPIILMIISSTLFLVAIVFTFQSNLFSKDVTNHSNPSEVEEETEKDPPSSEEEKGDSTVESETQPSPSVSPTVPDVSFPVPEVPSTPDISTEPSSESEVLSYFQQELDVVSNQPDSEDVTLREKIKNGFITIVDFIFYDREIKGYTFSELTTSAKLKVIEIALKIDSKIDEYFPNYKETIKDQYTSIKGKLGVKYLELTAYLCETVGEETCNQAKENFRTMKDSFATSWEFLKELASSGSSKVKEFYENWRDSE